MFAISFDMVVSDLEKYYGSPYHSAYNEIKKLLYECDFVWIQGSVYVTQSENLYTVTKAMMALDNMDWFRKSVRDIRAFRIDQWSDFTQMFKIEKSSKK
ncbi:virulence protein [Capnocytophaga sp.]|uniref:virulence protein n=1 Tax=Capnocytophaga sp. TaxID=44737 RepID=UPI0026DC346D|nr:virulence protein [Capnocytophaga sp.]MDO5106441.1 virulence protein [Capnocytophaga sp.]